MLETTTRHAIGHRLRAEHRERPKGAIPASIWRLLLALEQTELGKPDGRARSSDQLTA